MFVVLWSSYQCWYRSALWYLSDPFCSVLKKKGALKIAYHLQFHHSQSVSCSRAWSPGCNIYKVRLGLPAAAIWPRGLQLTPDGTYLPEIHSNKFISVISLLGGILTDVRTKFPPNNSELFKTYLDNAFFKINCSHLTALTTILLQLSSDWHIFPNRQWSWKLIHSHKIHKHTQTCRMLISAFHLNVFFDNSQLHLEALLTACKKKSAENHTNEAQKKTNAHRNTLDQMR